MRGEEEEGGNEDVFFLSKIPETKWKGACVGSCSVFSE